MIQTDDQLLPAQQCIGNLRRILLEARKVHSQQVADLTGSPLSVPPARRSAAGLKVP